MWVLPGAVAAVFCLTSAAAVRRSSTTPVLWPPLTAGQARLAAASLALSAAVCLGGVVWTVVSLGERASPLRALVVVLVAYAVRRAVILWRHTQARMVWSPDAELDTLTGS